MADADRKTEIMKYVTYGAVARLVGVLIWTIVNRIKAGSGTKKDKYVDAKS